MANHTLGVGYLRAEDLISGGKWCEKTYTIKDVHAPGTIKGPDRNPINKPIVDFEETDKSLVLGRINYRLLRCETGATLPKELIGQQITLYPVLGNWFGQTNVTSQRIRVSEGKPRPFLKSSNLGTDITGRVISQTVASQSTPNEEN